MPLLFDPYAQELKLIVQQDLPWNEVQRQAAGLRQALRESYRNTPENKACPDAVARRRKEPGTIMVIHRNTGELRKFDIGTDDGRGSRASSFGLSEQLLVGGQWRVATLEEEQKELEARAKAQREYHFKNEQELRAKELSIAEKALQYVGAIAQQTAPAPAASGKKDK